MYRVHLAWAGFELTTLVVIGTDCIGSCNSNYKKKNIIWYFLCYCFENFKFRSTLCDKVVSDGCFLLVLRFPTPIQITAGNRHKQNSWFCKEIREDNFRFWWRRVHEDASQGMNMSKIEIFFFTARILQNQRMLCCGECFHD